MTTHQHVQHAQPAQHARPAQPAHRVRRRRGVLVRAAAATAALAGALVALPAPAALAACPAGDQCTALPDVDAGRVMLAATLDPWRVDSTKTAGAGESVLRVEKALVAKGFLAASAADGYWGTLTTRAWGAFERSIGQDAIATRNGLPSPWELRKIGADRFDVVKSYDVGAKVVLASVAAGGNSDDGTEVVNERTRAMFLEAQRNLKSRGKKGWDMVITQGGYCGSTCADASAGTHDGGGIIDVRTVDTDAEGVANRLAGLREVGFAAWKRSDHIHAVAINDYQMAWAVHGDDRAPAPILDGGWGGNCQIYEWTFTQDGLGGCDDKVSSSSPQRKIVTWEGYLAATG